MFGVTVKPKTAFLKVIEVAPLEEPLGKEFPYRIQLASYGLCQHADWKWFCSYLVLQTH